VGSAVLSADGSALTQWRVIFRQSPKVASSGHFGGRIVVAPGDTLFITLGERQAASESVKAQDLAQGHGKIMRIRSDGSVPADNPFTGQAGAQATIWSYGHRNVQGAALHPLTGELWATEHGPQGGDEVNRVRAGLNYGWPRVSYGCDYGHAPEPPHAQPRRQHASSAAGPANSALISVSLRSTTMREDRIS
jgi:glucose/arabinose dehydrogenase